MAAAQIAQLLAQTVSPDTNAMRSAEQQLRQGELQQGFGLILLELLRDASVNDAARQAGAIYFKNFVKRQWTVENGGIVASDRETIKTHLLSLMLQAPKPIKVQLGAGLEEISNADYPERWQSLLPELVQHLKSSTDVNVLKGTMETAHTVFLKFRSMGRSNTTLAEIKYTVLGCQETHLAVFKLAAERILSGSLPPDQLVAHFGLLVATIGVFYSLNVVDLPEFFEDHKDEYFKGMLALLKYSNDAVAGAGAQQGLLEEVKGDICECCSLYIEKYQEEFAPFLMPCVNDVFNLLVNLTQEEKNDRLVAKGIKFLSSAASTHWPQSPFEDPNVLSGICEKVVFPNILLRDADIETFEDSALEYIRRDMEAADQDTRRRSSMDLVKAISKWNEGKVSEILIGYIKTLIGQAGQVPADQSERFKDGCLYLCIAVAVKGQTQREGVTIVNPNINLVDFFNGIVAPELRQPLPQGGGKPPILRASCLKFLTVFRNQLPREIIGSVLAQICTHITADNPVVHTYAAICIEKLLTVKERNAQGVSTGLRYQPAEMKDSLLQMVNPILQIIAQGKGVPQNEYLMRCLARIFAFLKEQGAEAGLGHLRPLGQILIAMSQNPANPIFNHNLFEAIASIVKVCVPVRPDEVENVLLPAFEQILERNVTDFLPYTFQILGLLLDATSSVKPLYQALFGRLLTLELWRAQGNVPGLIRLLRAYFSKHTVFAAMLGQHMESILERFQFVLQNRKTESQAFDLVNAMYAHLPLEIYQKYFQTLVTVLLTRLQNSKSPKFQKEFVVSLSLFMHRDRSPAPGVLPGVLNSIQAGLLVNLLSSIWLNVLKTSLRLDERKVCTLAMAKIMMVDEVRKNPQAVAGCGSALISLLGLLPSTTAGVTEESDDELPVDGGAGLEYEVSFNKLRNTDLPGAMAGLAPDVPDLPAAAKQVLLPQAAVINQLAQSQPELQPLARFLQ
jgi:exportin-2 (importin alpha re-exporter)